MTSTNKWLPRRPSAYIPFFRRFTDERARELRATIELYEEVREKHFASRWAHPDALSDFAYSIADWVSEYIDLPRNPTLIRALDQCQNELLGLEKHIFTFPEIDWNTAVLTLKERVEVREFLRAKEHFLANEERSAELLKETIGNAMAWIMHRLPEIGEGGAFAVPLLAMVGKPNEVVDTVLGTISAQPALDAGLCQNIYKRFYENLCAVSNLVPETEHKKPFKLAADSDLPPEELVTAYLKGTPFYDLLFTRVPFDFTKERTSHMHVVGGSGAGKTQLLQTLILSDLTSEDPPALVIVDSQSDLISKITHLDIFDPDYGELSDRLILIDPRDTTHPPALNIFDVDRERFKHYDEATREQVMAGIIDTFDYLFSGIIGADLTAKQQVFFRFLARLMLALPETFGRSATMLDIIALMDDPAPYLPAMQSLPPIQRAFFERDFPSKAFTQTREQIRYRLNAVLENPTLARLFTAQKNRIDIFREINEGSIICVDTAKEFLKGASAHFGRIFISLALQAVLERAAIPEGRRRRVYLVVDEAAEYFDSNIDDLLTQARKYGVGCLFAHQYLEQCTPPLRASLAANTSIKMASAISTSDARTLAPDLRTTPDFILSQPKLHFACHVRNQTESAVSLSVPFGLLEDEPRMSLESYEEFRRRNRDRVSASSIEALPSSTPDDDPKQRADAAGRVDPDDVDTNPRTWG